MSDITPPSNSAESALKNVSKDNGRRMFEWSFGVSAEMFGRTAEFCLTTQ